MSFEDEARERINSLQDQVTELASLLSEFQGHQMAQHWVLQVLITTHPEPQVLAEALLRASDRLVDSGYAEPDDQHWYKPLQGYAALAAETKAVRDEGA